MKKNNSNSKVMDSYFISHNTYMIESIIHENKLYSRIYDKTGEFIVKQKPISLIRNACHLMGSSYKGSRELSKRFFGNRKQKLPILITQDFGVPCIFFPLLSPLSKNNVWVSLNSIINIRKDTDNTTIITLKNEKEIKLNVSHTSFSIQYVDSSMYQKYLIRQRTIFHKDDFPL